MDDIRRSQRLLVGHGALVLLYAFVVGFGFLFFLIGEIRLWPFPGVIDYQLTGTYDAWRMAHMEGITNGFGLWLMAAVLPLLNFSAKTSRRLAIGMIITAWTIVVASTIDPLFPDARGLKLTDESNMMNDIAFLLFVIGIGIVIVIMIKVAIQCLFKTE
ncbi:MAG: hypothetical protein V2I26_19495 [Halieaceae bacterium]|jgi:hypothetical protein|nr:hypothetical protein [Halieaceae bacterium]